MKRALKEWICFVLPVGVVCGAIVIPGAAWLVVDNPVLVSLRLPIWEQIAWGGIYGVLLVVLFGIPMWIGSKTEPRIQLRQSDYERLLEEAGYGDEWGGLS